MSLVRFKRSELPEPDEKREAELTSIVDKSDTKIDCSDIPPPGDEFWNKSTKGQFYRPVKILVTVRIDTDVMVWLKEPGKGYQTRINSFLREAMMRALHNKQ
jgi:uncharacterized protein (DUF4415 family)